MSVRLASVASAEAHEAALWYERRQAFLGDRFLDELSRVISAISDHPTRLLARSNRLNLIRREPVAGVAAAAAAHLANQSLRSGKTAARGLVGVQWGNDPVGVGTMPTSNELLHQALALSQDQRANLALQLLRSLEDGADESAADWERLWQDEIKARLRALDAGEVETSDRHEAMKRLRSQLKERVNERPTQRSG